MKKNKFFLSVWLLIPGSLLIFSAVHNAYSEETVMRDDVGNTFTTPSRKIIPITIFMCGDVMTGRGIDQILPHPGNPRLYEHYVQSAEVYVNLGEKQNGPINPPVSYSISGARH
jgi:poly-gamma-glutamate synthesis protein (capsule biosynthesis protein)